MTGLRLARAALLLALVAVPTAARAAVDESPWQWPLWPQPTVVAAFDPPDEVWHRGHRGVDLLGATGQPVLAMEAGRVTVARPLAGRGVVVVTSGELRSTYEPVLARVHVGDSVRAGDVLGVLQAAPSHCAPRVCLHLGLKRGETYLDPLSLLNSREVRLKPIDAGTLVGISTSGSATTAASSPSSPPEAASGLSARSALGGAAAVTAALLAAQRHRRPHARG